MEETVREDFMISYHQKTPNHLIKRVNEASIVSVQCNDDGKSVFIHCHFTTEFTSKEKCEEYLGDLDHSTEQRYESLLATFFQKVAQNRKIFNIYRQEKWKKENS